MTVTGCDDCLCRTLALGRAYCAHPGLAHGASELPAQAHPKDPPPDWCPLRTAPLTIALEGGPCVTCLHPAHGGQCGTEEEGGMLCLCGLRLAPLVGEL